jgi:2-C-methyl-D-erythritol 4-phosphate cytidylyltransferase/2-C-methyl-D-erythritol 2,4-cyclodiphosphate synthase
MTPDTAVIVVAAGSGSRLGLGRPKAFVPLAGRILLEHAVDGASATESAPLIVAVVPTELVEATEDILGDRAHVVAGGSTRQRSVAAGLAALPASVEVVLVHDAARPLTPQAVFDRVVARVRSTGSGVIPGLPVADTVKRVGDGVVHGTVDRSGLAAVQTPQGFPRRRLDEAYAAATEDYTDDAAVFAAAGLSVELVPGDPDGFKITTSVDLERAIGLLTGGMPRTGIGIDVHAFGGSGDLRLATLTWPGESALEGHSDGDAVAHAVCDALLSAAGLGDIGSRFGTSDPQYAGAAGRVFLEGTLELLAATGWAPVNVAVQVVANRPRFAARRLEAEAALTRLVGAPVSVSATTTDGLGFAGRGEGVTAIATALVRAVVPPAL